MYDFLVEWIYWIPCFYAVGFMLLSVISLYVHIIHDGQIWANKKYASNNLNTQNLIYLKINNIPPMDFFFHIFLFHFFFKCFVLLVIWFCWFFCMNYVRLWPAYGIAFSKLWWTVYILVYTGNDCCILSKSNMMGGTCLLF